MKKLFLCLVATSILLLSACNNLSPEAKKIVGDYYIPELSLDTPIFRLNNNGSCVMTAIKPDVLTYSVEGKWNVENDSLLIDLDPSKITIEGDSSLIADIPTHRSYFIVSFNDLTLEVKRDGLLYNLHRRSSSAD